MENIKTCEELLKYLKSNHNLQEGDFTYEEDVENFKKYLKEKYSDGSKAINVQEEFIKFLQIKYGVKNEPNIMNLYENKAKLTVTVGKSVSEDKTLIIVGGQSGAGKSRLIKIANRELNNNAVILDFDELRELHPNYNQVSQYYSEWTHRILHPDTEHVKNETMDYVMEKGYNVIYEGALRNTAGFIEFANKFKEYDYNIKMKIMAVPQLESYGSTFFRYAFDLSRDKTPRWVEKAAHDGSYTGVLKTVKEFIDNGLTSDIGVYVRSQDEPRKIYLTEEHQYSDAITAIQAGREQCREKAYKDYNGKYTIVKQIFQDKKPELLGELKPWEELYNSEAKYFEQVQNVL